MGERVATFWILSLLLQQATAQVYTPFGNRKEKLASPIIRKGPLAGILLQTTPGFLITEWQTHHQNILVDLDPSHTFNKVEDLSSMPPEVKMWAEELVQNTQQEIREMLEQLKNIFVAKPEPQNHHQQRFAGFLISAVVMAILGAAVGTSMSTMNSISVQRLDHKMAEMNETLLSLSHHVETPRDNIHKLITFVNHTAITVNEHSKMLEHSIRLHAKYHQQQQNQRIFQEPMNSVARKLLRETQDTVQALTHGKVPLHLISTDMMHDIYSKSYGQKIEETLIALAFDMSSSCLTYIDIEQMRIGFVLNIPYIQPQNTYLMKIIHNVGVWKNDLLWAITTPKLVSFISNQEDVLLVPDLSACIIFKDVNYLCAGKPFKMNSTQLLCGISPNVSTEDCLVEVSHPDTDDQTRTELVGQQWLVNSNQKHMMIHYISHGTSTQISYPHPVSLVTIPRGVVATIGGKVLFHVRDEPKDTVLEIVDTFGSKQLVSDPDLQFLLTHKTNHTLQLNLHKPNVTVKNYKDSDQDQNFILQHNWVTPHNIFYMISLLFLIFWALGVTMQVMINTKKIRNIQKNLTNPEFGIIPTQGVKSQVTCP